MILREKEKTFIPIIYKLISTKWKKKINSGQGNHATLARAFSLLTILAAEELIIISTQMLCSDKIQHITLLLLNE